MFNFLCITFLLICLEHNPHIPEIINWNYSSYRTIFRIRKREINLFYFSLIKKCSNAVDYGEFDFLPNLGCSTIECHLRTGLWGFWFPPNFRLFCYRMPPPYWAMRLPMRKKCQIFKLLKPPKHQLRGYHWMLFYLLIITILGTLYLALRYGLCFYCI